MYTQVKISTISLKPKKWDKKSNALKMESFFRKAALENPDIILTPEGVLEGYCVYDVLENRHSPDEFLQIAEPIDGPYIKHFQNLAKELSICLCFGFAERIGSDVYNSAVFIDQSGDVNGKYHKTQLSEGTNYECNFNRVGSTIRAFDTPFGRMGFVICNDRWNPMIPRTLVLDGAQLILIPSYGDKSKYQNTTVLARSRENGVPIAEANVGMNLIISKGEIVAYEWGNDKITTASVEIPAQPSTLNAREYERQYLDLQGPEMELRYQETLKRVNGEPNKVALANRGKLIATSNSRQ